MLQEALLESHIQYQILIHHFAVPSGTNAQRKVTVCAVNQKKSTCGSFFLQGPYLAVLLLYWLQYAAGQISMNQ